MFTLPARSAPMNVTYIIRGLTLQKYGHNDDTLCNMRSRMTTVIIQRVSIVSIKWHQSPFPQPDTCLHSETTGTHYTASASLSVSLSVYMPSFHWHSLHLPTDGWPGLVDMGGWLKL